MVIVTAGEPKTNLQTNCAVPVPPLPSMIRGVRVVGTMAWDELLLQGAGGWA